MIEMQQANRTGDMEPTAQATRVLIVEDEVLIAETVRTKLTKLGYVVSAMALSGEEALAVLDEARPDVILMDIKLGGELDGINAAERIRERYSVPIIFVTAFSDDETIARVKRVSPYGYIIKPFQLNDLRTNIELALHRYNHEQTQRASQVQLQEAMRYLQQAFLVMDAQGTVQFANIHPDLLATEAASRLPGHRLNYLLQGVDDLEGLVAAAHSQTASIPLPQGVELQVPGGIAIGVEGALQSVRNEQGVVTGLLLNFREAVPVDTAGTMPNELLQEAYSLHHKAQREWAYNLHEGLGQVLSAAKMNLETVEPGTNGAAAQQLEQSKLLLDDAVGRVRKLTQAVMPNLLADFGLAPAVESFLRRLALEDARIQADIAPQTERLPEVVEYHAYRLVQELVQALLANPQLLRLTVRLSLDATSQYLVLALGTEPAGKQLLREPALEAIPSFVDARSRLRLVGGTMRWSPSAAGAHSLEVDIPTHGL